MVETDRIELNKRFQEVYKLLETRGEIVKNHSNKSKSAFAEKLLGSKQYGHIITQFLKGKRHIDYKHARKLCGLYQISLDYMIDGVGSPFDTQKASHNSDNQVTQKTSPNQILFTTVSAFANAGIDSSSFSYEAASFFSLPDMSGRDLVAFNIEGRSMEPIINSGDMVICKPVEDLHSIKDNQIYAVKQDGKVWIKHVKKVIQNDRVTHLELISANYLDYPPFIEEVNYTTRFFKVIRRVENISS
ncbi:MAG: LexA family transcriptional regulator [Saprospiraceae bacterium]